MLSVAIQPVPAQTLKVVLGGQNCVIALYQKAEGLFFDITADSTLIVAGVICRDADPLVCIQYTGFVGNLIFVDTQGSDDPTYTGLGSRFTLVYLTADEFALLPMQ